MASGGLSKRGKLGFTLMPSLHLIIVRNSTALAADILFSVYDMTNLNLIQEVRDSKFLGTLNMQHLISA